MASRWLRKPAWRFDWDGHNFGQDGQSDFFGSLRADVEADGAVNALVAATGQ